MRMFRKIGTFRGDSALSTWLHRLAVNVVLMHLRRKKNKPEHFLDEADSSNQGSDAPIEHGFADPSLTRAADRLDLARAIRELPPWLQTDFSAPRRHRIRAPRDCQSLVLLGGQFQIAIALGSPALAVHPAGRDRSQDKRSAPGKCGSSPRLTPPAVPHVLQQLKALSPLLRAWVCPSACIPAW